MAEEYNEYKHIKAKLRLLEVLISKRDADSKSMWKAGGVDDSSPRKEQLWKAAALELYLQRRQSPASDLSDCLRLPLPALETACMEDASVSWLQDFICQHTLQ